MHSQSEPLPLLQYLFLIQVVHHIMDYFINLIHFQCILIIGNTEKQIQNQPIKR